MARAKTGINDGVELASSTTAASSAEQKWKRSSQVSWKDLIKHEEIGAGAFGKVYRASLKGTEVAVKVPAGDGAKLRAIVDKFVDEFELMMTMRHPNVLLTMGIAMDGEDGVPGIVMEHMQASLLDVITLPFFKMVNKWDSALLSIASDVSKGMSNLHHLHGLYHRDLKPANILLDEHWTAKICDFGTALSALKEENVAEDQNLLGTPPYMAPEIVSSNDYSPAGDVWAFGCVLVHMGSGHTPYSHLKHLKEAKELFEIIKSQEHSPLETLDTYLKNGKTMPASIVQLATKCCSPSPSDRPSFEDIVKALETVVGASHPRPLSRLSRDVMTKVGPSLGGGSSPKGSAEMMKTYNQFKTYDSSKPAASATPVVEPAAVELQEEEEPPQGVSELNDTMAFFQSMGRSFHQSFAGVLSPKPDTETERSDIV